MLARITSGWMLALFILLALSGCGAAALGAPQKSGGSTPASQVVTSVHAVRTSAFPPNHIPPFDRTVRDPPQVQRLYDAITAVKPTPVAGIQHCPADWGVLYHLTFYAGQSAVYHVDLSPSGCANLVLTTSFWTLFADTFGVSLAEVLPAPRSSGPSAPTPTGQP